MPVQQVTGRPQAKDTVVEGVSQDRDLLHGQLGETEMPVLTLWACSCLWLEADCQPVQPPLSQEQPPIQARKKVGPAEY